MNGRLRSYYVNQGYNPNVNSGFDTFSNTLVTINKAIGTMNSALTGLKTTHAYANTGYQKPYVLGSQALYNKRLSNLRKQLQSGDINRKQYFEQVQLLDQLRANVDNLKKTVEEVIDKKETPVEDKKDDKKDDEQSDHDEVEEDE